MTLSLPTRPSARWLVPSAILLALVSGCGTGVPALSPVQGKVTLDGVPVEKGTIRFAPKGGAAPAGAEIKAGAYSANVPPGDARVEITAQKVTGKKKAYDTPDSPMVEITKESIPAKYNTRSELEFKVEAGPNSKDFELKSK